MRRSLICLSYPSRHQRVSDTPSLLGNNAAFRLT